MITNWCRSRLLLGPLLLWSCCLGQLVQAQLSLSPIISSLIGGGPDGKMGKHDSAPQPLDLIAARGFIGEMYMVPSRDGTPLTIYRIINPYADQRTINRYPVLFSHGVCGDASQQISNSDLSEPRKPLIGEMTFEEGDRSMPFMLANNNYEVYMVDARGTNLNHRRMSTDLNPLEGNKYWNFTLDEQSQYDLPAAIDFVLQQSHVDKLQYVGYSESTLFMLALLSAQPHYQEKLVSTVLVAPVAYLTQSTGSFIPILVALSMLPDEVNGNYMPQMLSDTLAVTLRQLCTNRIMGATLCKMSIAGLSGASADDANSASLYQSAFKTTSIKSLKHFYQLHTQKRFGMYDFGPAGNKRQYGQEDAPNYNLGNIKLPTLILARGGHDFLSTPADQEIMLSQLGTKPLIDIFLPKYNHVDFFMAKKAPFEVNIPIARAMLDLLKLNCQNGNILRDTTSYIKPYKPVEVRQPSASRHVEIKSNLLPNLMAGIMEQNSAASLTNTMAELQQEPLRIMDTVNQDLQNVGLPRLPIPV